MICEFIIKRTDTHSFAEQVFMKLQHWALFQISNRDTAINKTESYINTADISGGDGKHKIKKNQIISGSR